MEVLDVTACTCGLAEGEVFVDAEEDEEMRWMIEAGIFAPKDWGWFWFCAGVDDTATDLMLEVFGFGFDRVPRALWFWFWFEAGFDAEGFAGEALFPDSTPLTDGFGADDEFGLDAGMWYEAEDSNLDIGGVGIETGASGWERVSALPFLTARTASILG
jgi:hypothetical protein